MPALPLPCKQTPRAPISCISLSALAAFGAGVPLRAAIFTWDGGHPGQERWTDAQHGNPNGDPPNDGTADLVFSGNVRLTPDSNGDWSVNSITFNSLAGGALTLQGASVPFAIANNDTDTQTITKTLVTASNQSWSATSGNLSLIGAITNVHALTITGAFNTTLSGIISGTGSLNKSGSGTLTLSGALTLAAGTTLFLGGSYSTRVGAFSYTGAILDFGATGTANAFLFASAGTGSGTLTVNNWTSGYDSLGESPMNRIIFADFSAAHTRWHSSDNQVNPVLEPAAYGVLALGRLLGATRLRRGRRPA